MNYKEQLLTKEWKSKRKIILKRDNFCCCLCKSKIRLQVHHKKYIFGRMAWEYPDSLLQTLCQKCHEEIHKTTTIKSEKEKSKFNKKEKVFKPKIKKKKTQHRTEKLLSKLSKEDRRIQSIWDKIKSKKP